MPRIRTQLIRYEPGRVMPEHVDGTRRLSVLVSGTLEERDARGEERVRVGSVGMKHGRFPHESRFGESGTTIVSVLLPNAAVAQLGGSPELLDDWRWHHSGAPTLAGLSLAAALRGGDAGAAAACLRDLLASFAREGRCPPPSPALLVIRDRLRDDPASAPDVDGIAEELGLHPVSVGRLFRRHFGCSMTRYRRRARVAGAARALLDGGADLVRVALDHGFTDSSHMCRHFRRELGLPPGALRRRLSSADGGSEPFKTEWTVLV